MTDEMKKREVADERTARRQYDSTEAHMKGTILDFLKLAAEKPELAKELGDLATKHGFQFSDEVSDEELDAVAGGATTSEKLEEAAEQLTATVKEGATDASEQWKMALHVIAETQQRQQQNVQKISSV